MTVLYVQACRVPLAALQGMADDQGSETAGVEQENVLFFFFLTKEYIHAIPHRQTWLHGAYLQSIWGDTLGVDSTSAFPRLVATLLGAGVDKPWKLSGLSGQESSITGDNSASLAMLTAAGDASDALPKEPASDSEVVGERLSRLPRLYLIGQFGQKSNFFVSAWF